MTYELDVDELEDVAVSFENVLDEANETLRTALEIGAAEVVMIAKGTDTFTDQSGALRGSIMTDPNGPQGDYSAGTLEIGIGFGATSDPGEGGGEPFPYGLALEFGSVAHPIAPRFRTILRIPVEGGFAWKKEVQHPGTAELGFMRDALEQAGPVLEELVADAIELAFVRSGFTG